MKLQVVELPNGKHFLLFTEVDLSLYSNVDFEDLKEHTDSVGVVAFDDSVEVVK